MVWCRDGVDMCGSICRNGVPVGNICYDGQEMCGVALLEGFSTSYPTLIQDIQAPNLFDANAQIRIGFETGLVGGAAPCDPGVLHVRNGGIDTLVNRTGAPDDLCTIGGSTAPSGPVGSYIGSLLNDADIDGIAIDFVSATDLDQDTFAGGPIAAQSTPPPTGTAEGAYFWQAASGTLAESPYTPGTFVDPSTVGYIGAGAFADGNVPGRTTAGYRVTLNVIYRIRYATSGNVISVPATMVAEARGNAPPL